MSVQKGSSLAQCLREEIEGSVGEGVRAITFLQREESLVFIEQAAQKIVTCFQQGGKLLIAGNGGSLCDAMHFAEEMTGVFRETRRALPAIALSDPGHLTCVANDLGYEQVFARSIEAFGKPGDVFIGLTTSGNSPNIVQAVSRAKELGLGTMAFLGKTGGQLNGAADLQLLIEGFPYSDRVQEAHMTAIHIIIQMVEKLLFHVY